MTTPPPYGFGAAGLGNLSRTISDEDAWRLLEVAWASGIRHFDTAPHYGLGLSERRLGAFLATKSAEEYTLSTKVGRLLAPRPNPTGQLDDEGFVVPADYVRVWDVSEDGVRAGLAASLERLGLPRVHTLYLHDPERSGIPHAVTTGLTSLAALKKDGLVARIGVASMTNDTLLTAARTGLADELMVAGRYTLLDPGAGAEVLPACLVHGVEVVAAAVFNSGLTAAPTSGSHTFDYAPAPAEVMRRAEHLQARCDRRGVSLRAAALQFPLRHPAVRAVVAGSRTPEQLRDNLALLHEPLPPSLWSDLDALVEVAG